LFVFSVPIGEIRALTVSDEEKIAKHIDMVSLLPLSEKRHDGHIEVLPQQVEECRLKCGDGMNRGSLVVGLKAAARGVEPAELTKHAVQDTATVADLRIHNESPGILQYGADRRAPGNLTHSQMSRVVVE
jgi:hypothetical protein